jgi:hypothetical protein
LGEFLAGHPEISPSNLSIRDRVVGRAAAFLIVRLGIRTLGTDVISQRAVSVLEGAGVAWTAQELVERIGCQTEDLLERIDDGETAWKILRGRRQAALSRS